MAMGILASGVALGGVLGLLLGGYLEASYGWRVAFMTVGVPGFICAFLVARLHDPSRAPTELTVRSFLRNFHVGVTGMLRALWPLVLASGRGRASPPGGSIATTVPTPARRGDVERARSGSGSRSRSSAGCGGPRPTPAGLRIFEAGISSAFDDIVRAGKTVLHTPTLVYVFLAGAMISFGINGIVGWGPTFVSRELELTAAQAAGLLGKWGLIAGTAGTLFGGLLADWLRRRYETGRVIAVALGLLLGGPLAVWLLTIRDQGLFQLVFVVAFFCLSWYNGPITAVIFDVVPARISATVAGGYLLFIHLAGDAIALPLVGTLSDRFGLDRAILLLPLVVILGGVVVLGATRTVSRDMGRIGRPGSGHTGEWSPEHHGELLPHAPIHQLHQLIVHPLRPVRVVRPDRLRRAVAKMVVQHRAPHPSQGLLDRRDLGEHVRAVALLLHHFLQAAHLALDPPEPGQYRSLDLGIHGQRVGPPPWRARRGREESGGVIESSSI